MSIIKKLLLTSICHQFLGFWNDLSSKAHLFFSFVEFTFEICLFQSGVLPNLTEWLGRYETLRLMVFISFLSHWRGTFTLFFSPTDFWRSCICEPSNTWSIPLQSKTAKPRFWFCTICIPCSESSAFLLNTVYLYMHVLRRWLIGSHLDSYRLEAQVRDKDGSAW